MVPRLVAAPIAQQTSHPAAPGEKTRGAVGLPVQFAVVLKRPRGAAKRTASASQPPHCDELCRNSRAMGGHIHLEKSTTSSERLKRGRKERICALKNDNVSGSWSPQHKGLAELCMTDDEFDEMPSAAEKNLRRQCFQPAWSLIGTFKASLHSLVDVNPHHDVLKWLQQTPKDEFQQMRIPLSSVKDVRVLTARATQDVGSHWVVIRTSTKPTQIVFGFEKLSDAKRIKSALQCTLSV